MTPTPPPAHHHHPRGCPNTSVEDASAVLGALEALPARVEPLVNDKPGLLALLVRALHLRNELLVVLVELFLGNDACVTSLSRAR
jgi:hypothetical protein